MPAGVLTKRGWKSKPKFKDDVVAWVAFDVDVGVNDDEHDDDDDSADAQHLDSQSHLGCSLWRREWVVRNQMRTRLSQWA